MSGTDFITGVIAFVGGTVILIGGAVVISVIVAIPTFYLWNWLMPIIFGLSKLTFIQAIGVNLLCECLFKARSSTSESKKK